MYLGGLCVITDRSSCRISYEEMVLRTLRAGARWVQYRDKISSKRAVYEEAVRLRNIARDFEAVFIVNDYPDIAHAADADGVHLGQDDLPLREARKIVGRKKIVGISTHNLNEAIEAERNGADYIGVGPVFQTGTKDAGLPKGTALIREIKRQIHIPVVAIGGINLDNIMSVMQEKADAVAVASAILSGNIEDNTRKFLEMIKSFKIAQHS